MTPAGVLLIHDKPPGGGGVRAHVEALTRGLRARGRRVSTLRLQRDGDDAPEGDDAVLPARFREGGEGEALLAAAARAGALRPGGAAHLHLGFTSLSPEGARALRRAPRLVVSLHDVGPFCPSGTRLRRADGAPCVRRSGPACFAGLCAGQGEARAFAAALVFAGRRAAIWRALRQADVMLAPSRYLRDLAAAAGMPADRLRVAPHGVPPPAQPPSAPPSASRRLVLAGRLVPEKGAMQALEALARLRDADWTLSLCGDGPERPALRARAQALGLAGRVAFLGRLDRPALSRELAGARAALFPTRLPEGLGLSGLEALAHGRPVAGVPLGGAADWLIHGETGLAPARPGPDALAEAIGRLLEDPALADRLGARGAALAAARWSEAAMLDAVEDALQPPSLARRSA